MASKNNETNKKQYNDTRKEVNLVQEKANKKQQQQLKSHHMFAKNENGIEAYPY